MVTQLKAEKEKLDQWMRTPKLGGGFEDRSALMAGGAGFDANGIPAPAASSGASRRGPRVFGQETEKTRGVDDGGLVQVRPRPLGPGRRDRVALTVATPPPHA